MKGLSAYPRHPQVVSGCWCRIPQFYQQCLRFYSSYPSAFLRAGRSCYSFFSKDYSKCNTNEYFWVDAIISSGPTLANWCRGVLAISIVHVGFDQELLLRKLTTLNGLRMYYPWVGLWLITQRVLFFIHPFEVIKTRPWVRNLLRVWNFCIYWLLVE